jgi:hypothetical protein
MRFTKPGIPNSVDVRLDPRSLLLMTQEARFEWEHEVKPEAVHKFGDQIINKSKRYSVVFWKIPDVSNEEAIKAFEGMMYSY